MGIFRSLRLVIRTDGDTLAIAAAVRGEVRRVDPALPVSNVKTMEDVLDEAVRPQRFDSYLLGAFAAIALILAAVGVGGVMAYSVTQRIQEIGIRVALGAQRGTIVGMVLRRGMLLAGVGITAGLLASLAGTRIVSTFLFGVGPRDPWTFVIVTLVLAGTALIAILVPAYRASRVDPIVAIHYE
jgi:ABC-type antimicrobial peptide transport system permease subunit